MPTPTPRSRATTRPIETGKGALLRDGADLAFVAYGAMVPVALEAAKRLEAAGLDAAVFNARFVRPLDGPAVEALARRGPARDHARGALGVGRLRGGRPRATWRALPEPVGAVVRVLGVPDRLVPHGERADWLARFGLSAEALCGYAVRECEAARTHRR